jgi:carbon-monoxide dehydrogenase medium subunit
VEIHDECVECRPRDFVGHAAREARMKPAPFEYHAPETVAEAVALLERHGGEARLLAGGQSLVPMMNFRLAAPAAIVDLNRIGALAYVAEDADAVRIGAMTRQRTVEFSPVVAAKLPLLRDAVQLVGHLPTRSRGTVGGSLAHADPSAEIPMVLLALDGDVLVRGARGERRIAAADLFRDALTTSLAPDEILLEARFPAMRPGAGWAVEEFSRRHGDFALAAIAVVLVRDGARCVAARIAAAGVAAHPLRLDAAEQILLARGLDAGAIEEAAAQAADGVEPLSDQAASGAFRLHLAQVLTARALARAVERAR